MPEFSSARITRMSPQFLVKEMERSISFYAQQLGFDVEFRVEDFYTGLVKDGFSIHLKLGCPSEEERTNKKENNDLDIVFNVQGVDELYREYLEKGIEIVQPLCEQPYGREFYISDPDGYILAFLE